MRVISNNVADVATLQTTTPLFASTPLSNLQNDVKSKVCRTTTNTGRTLNVTATWGSPQVIGAVVFAMTTCETGSTMRVVAYANSGDTTPIYDVTKTVVGAFYADHNSSRQRASYACHWLDSKLSVGKVEITLTSPSGAAYVQASRLIIGDYWEPSIVDMQGTSMSIVDMSEQFRTDSGDMYVNVKPQYRKQTLALPSLGKTDRAMMWQLLWGNGLVKPLYISVYPNNADAALEQMHQIFGRLVTNPVMTTPYFSYMAATIDIEEV